MRLESPFIMPSFLGFLTFSSVLLLMAVVGSILIVWVTSKRSLHDVLFSPREWHRDYDLWDGTQFKFEDWEGGLFWCLWDGVKRALPFLNWRTDGWWDD